VAGTRLLSTHHRKLSTCAASRGCCFQSSNLICKASCTKYTSRTGWKCCERPLRQVLHSWSSRPDKRLNLRKGSEGKNKAEMAGALPLQVIWALHGPSSACRSLQATALSPTTLNQNVSLLKCLGSSEKHNSESPWLSQVCGAQDAQATQNCCSESPLGTSSFEALDATSG
jgi:hypothetical protein